jgi:phage anti-repressor protein
MSEFSMELAQSILDSNEQFPINFDDAWKWLGYARKSVAKRNLKQFSEGMEYCSLECKNALAGRPSETILLTIDCFKMLAMMAKTDIGNVARKYFIECEKIAKEKTLAKPKTALELAKEQVKLLEQIELQEALIASLEEDNERQAEVIDELFDYSSIIRIAKYNGVPETNFSWRKLKVASQKLDKEIKQVPCPRFVTKNLYSHDAWRIAYPGISLPETTTLVIKHTEAN